MTDFLGLMKQAAELKSKMDALQAELDHVEVEGSSGAGLVTVRVTAKGAMKGVKIDARGAKCAARVDVKRATCGARVAVKRAK